MTGQLTCLLIFASLLSITPFDSAFRHSLKDIKSHQWKIEKGWFGDPEVTLKALRDIPVSDTIGLQQDLKELKLTMWRLKETSGQKIISFDSSGNFNFTHFLWCPVGEYLFNVSRFDISSDTVYVEFQKYYWTDSAPAVNSAVYLIAKSTSDEIGLIKK